MRMPRLNSTHTACVLAIGFTGVVALATIGCGDSADPQDTPPQSQDAGADLDATDGSAPEASIDATPDALADTGSDGGVEDAATPDGSTAPPTTCSATLASSRETPRPTVGSPSVQPHRTAP